MSNTKKNYIYNLILNISNVGFCIITLPIVSRRLGSEQVGIYSYANSIVTYFMLFCLLGIKNYGNRLIAGSTTKEEKSKNFFGIYSLQMIMSTIVMILYLIYIFTLCNTNYKEIGLIQSIYLLSAVFDIGWFFYGNEDFKPSLIIGTITKFFYFLVILIFVNNKNDLNIYAFIMGVYTLLNNLLLFPLLRKRLVKTKITVHDITKHLKPCLILFLPIISVSIYKIMDKIMLGNILGTIEVGYYDQAEKIINIPLQLISTLGTVMLPKMSNIMFNNPNANVKHYISNSLKFIMFLITPIVFGLICVIDDFVPLFLGDEFIKSSIILKILSISILFITYGNVVKTHYIIPRNLDRILSKSVFLAAISNLILNTILIPKLASFGAAIATLVAEFIVVFYQSIRLKDNLELLKYFKIVFNFILKCSVMSILVLLVGLIPFNYVFVKLFVQVLIGIISYIVLNINYINSILIDFPLFNKFKCLFAKK